MYTHSVISDIYSYGMFLNSFNELILHRQTLRMILYIFHSVTQLLCKKGIPADTLCDITCSWFSLTNKLFGILSGMAVTCSRQFYYAPRRISGEHIVAASSMRPCVRASVPLLSTQILGNCLSDFNETSWEY